MKNATKYSLVGLAAAVAMIGGTASATELNFNFVGTYDAATLTAEWTQLSHPTPITSSSAFTDVAATGSDAVTVSGVKIAGGAITSVTYYPVPGNGGFVDDSQLTVSGPQLFSGTEAAPIFAPGVYTVEYGTLTVTAVPEPATWAMMLLGLGMIGFAARRRQKTSVTYA